MVIPTDPSGFSQRVGISSQGLPIYVYFERATNTYHYVVVFPDGKVVYSNEHGQPLASTNEKPILPGAVFGGAIGFLAGGPVAALIGAALGAFFGDKIGDDK